MGEKEIKNEEKKLTRKQLNEIYAQKVYDNEPIDINKLSKKDRDLVSYAIQIGWLNYLYEIGKITQEEHIRIKSHLLKKYKIEQDFLRAFRR